MTRRRPWFRFRLWTKLAVFAALGVVVTHAMHLVLGNRISTRALARELEALGHSIARTIAEEAAEAVLVDDRLLLHQTVRRVVGGEVVYCFIVRDGRVLASSFAGDPPAALVALGRGGDLDETPVVVSSGSARVLDIARPILSGTAGVVRIGIDMRILSDARRDLAVSLGLVALAVIAAGIIAALLVGRLIARPVATLVGAVERFDPAREVEPVTPQGGIELAGLAERVNEMMVRVKEAHDVMERARQKGVETERLVALGTLVGGLAHEINNPLAGIKNCQRRLVRGDLSDEKRAEYLGLMGEGLDRIEEVVKRVLDFGRPQPLALREVLVRDLVRGAERVANPLFEKRRIRWEEVIDGREAEAARVIADPKRVGEALLNLVLNAAYVTPDGGVIRARVCRRTGFWGIAIEDDGPGIPREIRDRILDPFFSTKPEGEGTGLGLSVTRTIVGVHGGELTFDFPAPRGTVATIWLREAEGRA